MVKSVPRPRPSRRISTNPSNSSSCVELIATIYKIARDLCNRRGDETVQRVGKSKIGRLNAKNLSYPQLRLPYQYSSTIGDVASVFETQHEGKQAFLIVTEHSVPNEHTVLKPSEEVLKPVEAIAAETRLSALESDIRDLKSSILKNEGLIDDCIKKGAQENGLGRIRTGDLRRVKATS
jgi:hypothetical protein